MTTIGDPRWKQTQEKPGPPNNLVNHGPDGVTQTSRAGNIVLTTSAMTTNGKGWMPAIPHEKGEEKGLGQRPTKENRGIERP